MTFHQLFTVPPPAAAATLVMKDGALIRLRRYGRTGRTRLVLSHGNGLAINAYAPFWLPLAQDYDVVVFDMRNHGENPLHKLDGHTWDNFFLILKRSFKEYESISASRAPSPQFIRWHRLQRSDTYCVTRTAGMRCVSSIRRSCRLSGTRCTRFSIGIWRPWQYARDGGR
jgi:hypothetical protein